MARRLDYRWHLRQVMAARGMFQTTELVPLLADRGIRLSSSQVYRLVPGRPAARTPAWGVCVPSVPGSPVPTADQ